MSTLKTRFQSPRQSPGFMMWKVTAQWQRCIRQSLEPLGLSQGEFVLLAGLAWLTDQGKEVTQVALAQHTRTDVMMTSQVLRRLESKGMIERTTHAADTRAKALRLTQAGLELVNEAIVIVEAADQSFFEPILHDTAKFLEFLRVLDEPREVDKMFAED